MRILITNDDGITAPGLEVAREIAAAVAGDRGDVWIVAPEAEQSGVAHCVSYTRPMRLVEFGPRRFAVEGSPADCVILACTQLMADHPPDLVISGVNRGHNVAEDTLYSGTVGGAMEGALMGVRAIALSQAYGREPGPPEAFWAAARAHGAEVVRRLMETAPWERDVFYNVNFPTVPAERVSGVRVAPQGRRSDGAFGCVEYRAPNHRKYFWLAHNGGNETSPADTDARLSHEGYVTVTPLRADLTARALMDAARAAFA